MPQTDLVRARRRAARLRVTVRPSAVKNKKLDVYQNGKKVASIGDIRYSDFLQHNDLKRRANYKARHESNRHRVGSPAYYADRILW